MQLRIVPSPTDVITLAVYESGRYPVFDELRARVSESPGFRALARPLDEPGEAVVLENKGSKALVVAASRWTRVQADGTSRTHKLHSDGYLASPARPIVDAGGRVLLGPSGQLSETTVKHVLAGGGFLSAGGGRHAMGDALETWFQVDLLVFEDGELAGTDPDRYAWELQVRQQAGRFVARQVRSALAASADPKPVLEALASLPQWNDERSSRQIAREARDCLRRAEARFASEDPYEWALRSIESRSELPKFYRRSEPG